MRVPIRRTTAPALGLVVLLAGCSGVADEQPARADLETAEAVAAAAITPDTLRRHVAALAADEMAGRGPGSAGDEMAREYLVSAMEELGLLPGMPDGTWQQPFEMIGVTAEAPATWVFRSAGGNLVLDDWEDVIAFSGVERAEAALVDAGLVFVGYGIEAPEHEWNDFKGVDVAGKVLVFMNNDPDWDPALFEGDRRLYYGRWDYKYEKAAEKGAAGAIIIHTTPSAGYPFQVVQTSWTGEQFEIPAGDEPRIEVGGWITEPAARRLFELAGLDLDQEREAARQRDFSPVDLGVVTSYRLTNSVRSVESANVLGRLAGADPELADEVVVFTAHHDHLGVGTPADDGDAIYNGALDNGAGMAQVLAIAEAFARLPQKPARTLLFNFVAAEEQGLLGSEYYAAHPTVAPGRIAANVNYDGGNIWGRTRDVTLIGMGKSSLDQVVERWAAHQGRSVKPDQFPDRGFFYRSDQLNFARIGVPAIYLDTGTEFVDHPEGWGRAQVEEWEAVHYHQPSDELTDAWVFDGMVEDAVLGFLCGLDVADTPELPRWNPGDEFEAARLEALEAVPGAR